MRHSHGLRRTLPAILALAAAGSALCPRPARAMIIRATGTTAGDAELAATAHQEGRALTGVVMVTVSADAAGGVVSQGTGTYLGPARDGRTGLVLTAAHVVMGAEPPFLSSPTVLIRFGSGGEEAEPVRVPGTRVVVHPRFPMPGALECDRWPSREAPIRHGHDLAVIEFDLAGCAGELKRLQVQPVPLHEGKDYQQPLLEARVAGFGQFGHAGSGQLVQDLRIHAGSTRVSHLQVGGQRGFHTWLPLAEGAAATTAGHEAAWLDLGAKPALFFLSGHGAVRVQGHERQALGAEGDSGGPLLLAAPGKEPELAGVFSCAEVIQLTSTRTGVMGPAIRQFYAAVPDHLDWINAVRKGEYGDSLVGSDVDDITVRMDENGMVWFIEAGETKADAAAAGAGETKVTAGAGETKAVAGASGAGKDGAGAVETKVPRPAAGS